MRQILFIPVFLQRRGLLCTSRRCGLKCLGRQRQSFSSGWFPARGSSMPRCPEQRRQNTARCRGGARAWQHATEETNNDPRSGMAMRTSLVRTTASRAAVMAVCWLLLGPLAYAQRAYDPGASDTEIKVGNVAPYTGALSEFATARASVFAAGARSSAWATTRSAAGSTCRCCRAASTRRPEPCAP